MNLFPKKIKREEFLPSIMAPLSDALEEHHPLLPGLDIVIAHTIKTVFIIDTTGDASADGLQQLADHLQQQGYYMHAVKVRNDAVPPRPAPSPALAKEQVKAILGVPNK